MVSETGVNAIMNGTLLASATSHWTASKCSVQVELTSDHGFYSAVTDNHGNTSSGSSTWAQGANSDSVTIATSGGSGLSSFFWVSALSNISGSTSSQLLTAAVSVKNQGTVQNLGSCSFVLAKGALE